MNGGVNKKSGGKEEEQDGLSVHSPCKAPNSSASSLRKEQSQVDLELKLLEALEIYPPVKLRGIHRHFVLYGLTEYMRRRFISPHYFSCIYFTLHKPGVFIEIAALLQRVESCFNRQFSASDVLQMLDRFYNLEMLKPDDEESGILNQVEEFSLPPSYFSKEES